MKISHIVPKYSDYCYAEKVFYWFDLNRYEFYYEAMLAEFGYDVSDFKCFKSILAEQGIITSYGPNLYEFDKQYYRKL